MPPTSKLDATDLAILRVLQADARCSNKEVAARVGLSASASLARVRQLQRSGVVRGFHAQLDPRAVGVGLQAVIGVRLARGSREVTDSFRDHALSLPEVVALYHVAGVTDFIVHVAVRDADHLRELATQGFSMRDEVAGIETSLVYEHFRGGGLPLYE